MPETVIPESYVDQVPRFVIPQGEILTNGKLPEKEVKVEAPVPAEPPKEAKPEVAEAATTEPEKEGEETTGKDPEKNVTRRFERRIDRAHRRAAEAQARAELLEKQIAELKAQSAPKVSSTAPRMEDFTDVQEYAKAYANFEKENALKDYERKQRETQFQTRQAKMTSDWEARATKAVSKYEDFEEIVGELKPTTPWAVAIMRSENGEDVAYHLGKHPQEARKILALEPEDQFLEIGRLSAKLAAAPTEKPKTPSKAPAPITPVAAGNSAPADEYKDGMSPQDYLKVRKSLLGLRR